MKTNEQIFEDVKKQGYITEQQIRLLKTRGNQQNKDVFDYTLLDTDQFGCGIPLTPSRLDNMAVRKNGKVTRVLKGGELYTGIEAIKYNILHLLSPVDMEIEDTFTVNGRRYKKLV